MLPAVLQINPVSQWQRGFLLFTHGAALLNAWWMSWPWASAMSALLLASLYWHWRKPEKIRQIQCLPEGLLSVTLLDGRAVEMTIRPTSVLTAHVLVLHLRGDGIKQNIVLWPDSADAEVLRQWRVYLRWIWPSFARSKKENFS
ncbi:protein YgfX [Chitinibacter sp. S2-10]|uniref:protein YgfX n=1 Tax=Chitinibacter sp. S2-10 TaxID=3373597 RepID=UPI003977A7E0